MNTVLLANKIFRNNFNLNKLNDTYGEAQLVKNYIFYLSSLPFFVIGCATPDSVTPANVTPSPEKPKLTIDIGWTPESDTLKDMATRFERDTGVEVKLYGANYRLAKNIKAPLKTDIICTTHDQFAYWIADNALQTINPSEEIKNANVNIAWDGMTQGGSIWAYPLTVEAAALYYNKKLIDTPPTTFEEIVALDKRLMAEKQVHAINWDYGNAYFSWPLFAAGGSYPFPRDALGGFDTSRTGVSPSNPGAVAALTLINDFVKNGVLPAATEYSISKNSILNNQVAMAIDGPWIIPALRQKGIDFGVKPLPTINGKPGKAFVAFWGCGFSKKANPDVAKKFMENYLLNGDNPKKLFQENTLQGLPSNKEAFKNMYQYEYIRELMQAVNNGKPMPPETKMGVFFKATSSAIQQTTSGKLSIEEALTNAEQKISAP